MRLLKQLVAVAVVALVGSQAVAAVQGNAFLTLILGLASAVVSVLVYAWVVRWSERREPVEVARTGAVAAFGRGTLIGVAMFVAVILNLAFLGDYRTDGGGSVTGALGLIGFMAAAAVTEELLFRGVLFRIVEGWIGTWMALTLTALLFGMSHLFNKDATLWGAIAIAIEAGGMLAAAYAATRSLWVTIGVHFGWNFAESGIFGTEVSGNGDTKGLLHGVTSGSSLLSGGKFGPEASVYSIVFGAILTIVFMWLAHRRGNLVPLRRRDRIAPTATLAQ
ncbi:CPBP family intramembrane glutamic endopeptidase [Actinoallomurus rhizosphaericola]|uniref:CPBP family intramembrane glutamic endopeptidase n=1 Tax=Actinoallomurus rhizosphaericola TaxID=2952536 RepID=UPI0020936DC2|nr:CPBP family intramembrane glutamic endopeptidase [Actinoallomurus rhizosphaericola]MCO5997628.1 CPBP family intramembrane metalloprotease [Actinoallomurus rhizosphaericola]